MKKIFFLALISVLLFSSVVCFAEDNKNTENNTDVYRKTIEYVEDPFTGLWMDAPDGSASLFASPLYNNGEGGKFMVVVIMSNDPFKNTFWTMMVDYSEEDGAYHYEDGVKTVITSNCVKDPSIEEDITETIEYTDGKGIFSINEDGYLVWINNEEIASDMLFMKVDIWL